MRKFSSLPLLQQSRANCLANSFLAEKAEIFGPSLQIIDLSVSGVHFGSLAASCAYIYNPLPLYNSPLFLT